MDDPKDNIQIKNLNLQIPNRDQIIYTSDNRAIGSMSSANNVDNTNSTYLRNRIEGTNEVKINNKTIKRKLINTLSNGSYEGAGRICYGDSGILADITYKTDNNTWSKVSSDLKSLAPNKYGYNIAHTLVDVDMYENMYKKDMYDKNTYNTNSWHLESWSNVTPNSGTLTFTRGIKENIIDWTKPVRFYYGNINAEKLYSRNAFSKFNAKLLHIYIGDAKGNYKSKALESFDKNNSKIVLHYYNKNNRIMQFAQNITGTTGAWCNMLVIVPEDCYQIEGIEFKLYTGESENTNYTDEVEAKVEISNFNINVWGLEEFVTTYITQELIIQRLKNGSVYKNCDIFNQPLLFNNSMRYDLKMSNSPCPKFNKDTYIEFNNESLRKNEFTSVSFYYKLVDEKKDIADGSYIIGTNLLSAAPTEITKDSDTNETIYNTDTDNVIVLTKKSDTYTLKVFFQNTKDNTDSTKFYNITDYFNTGVGIKFDISKTMLRINDNIVQADNTVHTLINDYDESELLPLKPSTPNTSDLSTIINDRSALGSLAKSLTLPGCYYNFKLYTENTSTNSVCLHLPMEEGFQITEDNSNITAIDVSETEIDTEVYYTVIDVSDTKSVNYITDVRYFTISNLEIWDSQDDVFYNTTNGYYTDIINSGDAVKPFKNIKYFPNINENVAKNFEYVYSPLEYGINCGGIELTSKEILGIKDDGNSNVVTIDNSNKLFTKTISTISTSNLSFNDNNSLKPTYTFDIFDSAVSEGLWHIHGTIEFGLPEAKDGTGTQLQLIESSGLVESTYTGTIGSLTLFDYKNKFTDSLTIDQYYYGSFTTDNKLTIAIALTTLNAGGEFNSNHTAITSINLTIDKLYFEDNIIASYRYDIDNADSEYYSGSYNITKYSSDQDSDQDIEKVRSLYFNNSSSDEIMTYDNFDNISQYTDISNSIIETNVYCNNLLVSPSTAIGTNSNPTTLLDNKNTLKISSKLKNITSGKYYDGNDYDLDVTYYTYLTSCKTDNYETYFSIDNVNTSSPSITRGTTNTALYGLTTPFEISTISELNSSKYGFKLNTNSTTNTWYLSCPTIQLETTSTISVQNKGNPVSLPLLRGYIIGDDYSVTISITTNYTITDNSANVANSNVHKLTKTYSSSDITKYDTTLSLKYYNQHVNTEGKTITQTLNFKKPSDIIITSAKITKDSTNTDGNTEKYFTLSITLGDTYGYTYSSECFTFIDSSDDYTISNKSYSDDNKTFTCTITVNANQTTINPGQIQIKPNNINLNIKETGTNNYYILNNIIYIDQDNYGSGIYYVSSKGNDTNAGTSSNSPILFDTALLRANVYSLLTGKPVYILVTADSSSKNNDNNIKLKTSHTINLSNNIYIIGVNNTEFTSTTADNIQDKINNGFETTSKITVTIDTDSYIDPNDETQYNSRLLNFVFSSTSYDINIYNIKFFNIHYTYPNPSNKTNYLGYIITSNSDVKLTNCEFNNCSPMYSIIMVSNNRKLTFNNVNYIRTDETNSTYVQFSDYWFDAYEIEVNNCIINLQLVEYTSGTIRTMFASGKAILNNVYIKVICNGTGIYYSDAWLSICDNGQYKKNTGAEYQYVLNYCTIILNSSAINKTWNNLILINSRSNTIQPSDEMNLLKITNSYLDLPYGIAGYNSKKTYMGNILLENCVYYNTIKNMHYSWNPSNKIDISSNYIITSSYEYTNNIPAKITLNSNGVYTIDDNTSILIGAAAPNNTTKDINNNIRSETTPTIGAVEYLKENGDPITLTKGLYIDLTNGNDNNTGLSWVSPKKTFKTNLDKVFADASFAKRYVSGKTKLNIYVTSGTETLTTNVTNNLKGCDYEIIITGGYNTTNDFTFSDPVDGAYITINGGGTFSNNKFTNLATRRLLHSNKEINVNSIAFNNFIFKNFCNTEAGNIIYINHDNTVLYNLTFNNCKFLDNYNNIAKIYLKANSGNINDVSFKECKFINNISSDYAGVLIFDGPSTDNNSTLIIDNCIFEKCYAGYNSSYNYSAGTETDSGGVYYTTYAPQTIEITNSIFKDNRTPDHGGALCIQRDSITGYYPYKASLKIDTCTFNGNIAGASGGALNLESKKFSNADTTISVEIKNSKFLNNQSGVVDGSNGEGGAIYYNNVSDSGNVNQIKDTLTIENCVFDNNYSEDYGGAIWMQKSPYTTTIKDCVFSNNYTKESYAGAVHSRNTVETIDVINCIFYKNRCLGSSYGGGAWFEYSLTNDSNTAVNNKENKLHFYNCTFYENHSNGTGGALAFYHKAGYNNVRLYNNIFWNNTSTGNGDNIYVDQYANIISSNNIVNDPLSTISVGTSNITWDDKFNHIDSDPKLVPVLYEYNHNIDNNTSLKSLPVCNGSSAIDAGKYFTNIDIPNTDIRGAARATKTNPIGLFTNPTIGACEYLNRLNADEFTGICINSINANDYKVLLDENITINVYYPDLTAEAEEELHKNIKITQTPSIE